LSDSNLRNPLQRIFLPALMSKKQLATIGFQWILGIGMRVASLGGSSKTVSQNRAYQPLRTCARRHAERARRRSLSRPIYLPYGNYATAQPFC
jgi:hypothetical protein